MLSANLIRLYRAILLQAIFIPFFASAQHGGKSGSDRILLTPILKKANEYLKQPTLIDSLANYAFRKAKAQNNTDNAGRAAGLLFVAKLSLDANQALPWYDTSMSYLRISKNQLWMGYNNFNMGIQLGKKYKFEKGISYLLQAVKNFEQVKDTAMVGYAYVVISNTLHDFGNYESGKKYAQVAINVLQSTSKATAELKWRAMNVLAINYDDNEEYRKALYVHFKNVKNVKGKPFLLGINYNNIGNTYQKMGYFIRANKYLLLALQQLRKAPSPYAFAGTLGNLANVNLELGNIKKARFYADSALYYAKKSGSPEKLIDTYENLYKLDVKTHDFKQAFSYLKQRAELKDSLFSASKAEILYDLQLQFETEKKEKENQQLKFQSNLRAVARDRAESDKRFIIYAAIITLIALCLIFGLVYRNTIVKNRFAEEQKLNKALLNGEQNERIRIARDLHDSIGQLMSVVKMNVSNLMHDYPKDNHIDNTLILIDKTITEVRHISHNLIPEELNFGLFAALEDMFEKINSGVGIKVLFDVADATHEHQFKKSTQLSIYRIVQEIVGNIVKHAKATQINIEAISKNSHLIIAIKDNGVGFDTDQIKNSNGIGWKNITARVNLLDGILNIRSERLSGTQIEIIIPDDNV
ncbi:tetratricopeptide repeat-containing sensor histidine kinase [Mucilaginibacter segetis]|uniref:histidine kinase n=1 Tax=Mucilaginibacter segetis TaxID=2793071 RepID=A0A934PT38_9SPHI|nr:histidine kinase [Mucilaginibacter segetis]MBK0378686.1 hypothetical protein [Mucilaginibacter segetis]